MATRRGATDPPKAKDSKALAHPARRISERVVHAAQLAGRATSCGSEGPVSAATAGTPGNISGRATQDSAAKSKAMETGDGKAADLRHGNAELRDAGTRRCCRELRTRIRCEPHRSEVRRPSNEGSALKLPGFIAFSQAWIADRAAH